MDYRFKISGNTQPFLVKLYSGSTLVRQKTVEYPDTCAIFSNLNTGTTYNYYLYDNINKEFSGSFITPNVQLLPDQLQTIVFSALGTPIQPSGPPAGSFMTLDPNSPKELSINPSLSDIDCATVNAKVVISSDSNVNNLVNFYKSCGGGDYTYLTNYNTDGTYTPSIRMGANDRLCYSMSTIYVGDETTAGTYSGSSTISITSVDSDTGTFIPEIDSIMSAVTTSINYTISEITTTTTPQPTVITFNLISNDTSDPEKQILRQGIVADPPLSAGQSVRMRFTNYAEVNIPRFSDKIAYAISKVISDGSIINEANASVLKSTTGFYEDNEYGSIILNSDNIDDVIIELSLQLSEYSQEFEDTYSLARMQFNSFDEQTGGTFVFSEYPSSIMLGSKSITSGENLEPDPIPSGDEIT